MDVKGFDLPDTVTPSRLDDPHDQPVSIHQKCVRVFDVVPPLGTRILAAPQDAPARCCKRKWV